MRISWKLCPHCRGKIEHKIEGGAGTANFKLGKPDTFQCPKCDKPVHNGLKEWWDLGLFPKLYMIFIILWTALYLGVVLGAIVVTVLVFVFDLEPMFFVFGIAIGAVLVLQIWGLLTEVRESNRRILQEPK